MSMDLLSNTLVQRDSAVTLQQSAIVCGLELEGRRRESTRASHRYAKPTKRCFRRVVSDSPYYRFDISESNKVPILYFTHRAYP